MRSTKIISTTLSGLFIFSFVFVSASFAGSGFKTIDTAQLHRMVVDNAYRIEGGREKQFIVVDARTKKEYGKGHIFSAISIPEEDLKKSLHLLPKNKNAQIVVYCEDMRSGLCEGWAKKAETAGYSNIAVYSEGFSVWKAQHMPTAPLGNGH